MAGTVSRFNSFRLLVLGMIKARVYHFYKPSNLLELQERIQSEINKISLDEIANAVGHVRHRMELVRRVNGDTFSHLL